jgi:hypothetical protein
LYRPADSETLGQTEYSRTAKREVAEDDGQSGSNAFALVPINANANWELQRCNAVQIQVAMPTFRPSNWLRSLRLT